MVVASTEEVHSGGRIGAFDPSTPRLQVHREGQGFGTAFRPARAAPLAAALQPS